MSNGHDNVVKLLDGAEGLLLHVLDDHVEVVRLLVVANVPHHGLEGDVLSQISLVPAPLKKLCMNEKNAY